MKRVWMTAAAAVLALSVLAGCSGTDYPSSSTPSSRPNGNGSSTSTGQNPGNGNSGSSSSSTSGSSSSSSSSSSASSKPEETTPWKYQKTGSSITITGYDGELSGDITIPSKIGDYTVTCIGNNAFDGNEKITSLTVPGTVISIRQYAFRGCKNLKKITLQEGVESIGYYTFAGCTNLTEVNLPSTINYIENLAFRSCVNLEQIVIPENSKGQETKIQHCAFEYCSKLKKIYFPKTLKTIYYPFTGDTSVDYIYYGGTKEDWAKINITDGSIDSTTVILYQQKPADINTTPPEPEEPDDDLGDPSANAELYAFRQDVLKAFNVQRANAGLEPLRMNITALNDVAQQGSEARYNRDDFSVWQALRNNKVTYKTGKSWCGGTLYGKSGLLWQIQSGEWDDDILDTAYKRVGIGWYDGIYCIILIG